MPVLTTTAVSAARIDGVLARSAQMRGGGFGFRGGDPLHVSVRGFVRVAGFVDVGDEGGEGDAGVAQNFGAAGRGGGEDDVEHGALVYCT